MRSKFLKGFSSCLEDLMCCCALSVLYSLGACISCSCHFSSGTQRRARKKRIIDPRPSIPAPRKRALTLPLDGTDDLQTTLDQSQSPFVGKLPLEIRLMIYDYALGNKTVHFRIENRKLRGVLCSKYPHHHDRFTATQEPWIKLDVAVALLRTCRIMWVHFSYWPLRLDI